MAGLTFMLPDSCLIVTYRCPVVSRLVMEIIAMRKANVLSDGPWQYGLIFLDEIEAVFPEYIVTNTDHETVRKCAKIYFKSGNCISTKWEYDWIVQVITRQEQYDQQQEGGV